MEKTPSPLRSASSSNVEESERRSVPPEPSKFHVTGVANKPMANTVWINISFSLTVYAPFSLSKDPGLSRFACTAHEEENRRQFSLELSLRGVDRPHVGATYKTSVIYARQNENSLRDLILQSQRGSHYRNLEL